MLRIGEGNPLARTILVECAWASLRYNSWSKAVYERICGKQKTRKKKAAVALARKISVLAWAMLRDETDWDPSRMLAVARSFGKTPVPVQDALKTMKPKENSDQRKKRLCQEAREAKEAATKQSNRHPILTSRTLTISGRRELTHHCQKRRHRRSVASIASSLHPAKLVVQTLAHGGPRRQRLQQCRHRIGPISRVGCGEFLQLAFQSSISESFPSNSSGVQITGMGTPASVRT